MWACCARENWSFGTRVRLGLRFRAGHLSHPPGSPTALSSLSPPSCPRPTRTSRLHHPHPLLPSPLALRSRTPVRLTRAAGLPRSIADTKEWRETAVWGRSHGGFVMYHVSVCGTLLRNCTFSRSPNSILVLALDIVGMFTTCSEAAFSVYLKGSCFAPRIPVNRS